MRRIGKRRAAVCALAAALGGIAGTAALTATASAAVPAGGPGSAAGWQVISYDGISLRVPASWPVVNLATAPSACPRLDVHAVYLGTQGTDPSCPAAGVAGKTEAVQIAATSPGSPEALAATQATTIGGRAARTNPDAAVTHTITDVTGGTQVSLSYGGDPALIAQMRSSISVTSAVTAQAASAAVTPAGQVQGIFQGGGFDPCTAPSSSTMNAWLASPYRAIGAYIGGINRACAQPNLTSSWINTVEGQGWKVFPLYPGLQASCGPSGNAAINPNNAAAQGASSADDAAAQAASLGLPAGTPLVYDMEAYSGCGSEVITYLSAWDSELHARGYAAGVYESFSNVSDLVSASGSMTEPDIIDYAAWDGQATTNSSYMPSNMWTSHQRIHQYAGGHDETWGGQTINIDSDQLDANLGTVSLSSHGGFHIAVGHNTSGSAEMFAVASNGTLAHDYQSPTGSEGWSGWATLGSSPASIASNPAVASNQDGHLEVFARDSTGQVVHAWQGSGGTGGWVWGADVTTAGTIGATKGDPHAILRPDGDVAVFVTDTNGTVATTAQASPDGAAGWTAWSNIGGSCAGWPVPFTDAAGTVELFCRTTSGTLAINTWNGTTWNGWATAGASPASLTADPAPASNADGHTEVFLTTTSGALTHAWQNLTTGTWTWGTALTGSGAANTPTAITWPDGRIEVFYQQASSQLGHVYQNSANAAAGWSAPGSLGGTVLGSPQAWVNTSGTPEIAALDTSLQIAHTYWTGTAWIGWVQLGGTF